jgi:hypothetical protein
MFYFHLAEKLGMPVGEMLLRMDSQEITEWIAYFQIQRDGPSAKPVATESPEELSARLKAALFKKAK